MLRYFFNNSHREDEFYVYAFNNRVQLVQDFTSLPEALLKRVAFIKAIGSTALFDATYAAVEKVREGRHHRVILIFSDGEENSHRYSGRELQNLLRENDAQDTAVGMSECPPSEPDRHAEIRRGTDRRPGVVSVRLRRRRGSLHAAGIDASAAICHRFLSQ